MVFAIIELAWNGPHFTMIYLSYLVITKNHLNTCQLKLIQLTFLILHGATPSSDAIKAHIYAPYLCSCVR